MAYRELGVIEIREVLRRFCLGEGLRAIARGTGSDRKTVAKYVAAAAAAGLRRGDPGPTDEHVAAVLAAVRALVGGRPGQVPERLTGHREQLATWLAEGLRLTKIHRRLRAQGVLVPYSSLHRFARAHLGFGASTMTVRVAEPPPGEAAEVDFGVLGLWFDPLLERQRRIYGLLVTLCFSRYAFLAITLRQDLAAVLDGLESAWVFFGGVVKRLVEDNLKPVVTRPDRYAPGIDRVFLEYAQYRGFVVDPAIVRHATGKAKIEVAVQVAERWILARLRHETFFSLAALNARIAELLVDLNARPMRLYRASRRELFDRLDRPALRPLPAEAFVYSDWKVGARVSIDYHIELHGHYYSVPYALIHEHVDARLTATTVEIFHRGQRVAAHRRSVVRGQHTTDHAHMPKAHQRHLEWSPSRLIDWARTIGPQTAALVQAILADRPHPEQGYRSCLGILRLAKRDGPERLEAACARAGAVEARSYRHVDSILKHGLDRLARPEVSPPLTLPPVHEHVRGRDYYQ